MSAESGDHDRVGIELATDPNKLQVKCRNKDTRAWFKAAKARSKARMDTDLTHEDFTRLLLAVFEHHEPEAGDE